MLVLKTHHRITPNVMNCRCVLCDRTFDNNKALQQHRRGAPAHAFDCATCDRHFGSKNALDQHLQDSPAHAPSFSCESCNRSFDSEEAINQHLRDSPAHAPSFECEACNRSFGSDEALEQHLRNSRVHQQDPNTPLDLFFRSFPGFNYDSSLSPAESYGNLQEYEGWQRNDVASVDAWNRYQYALESELRMWFGAESDLAAWHALCRAIGVKPLPQTCEHCEEVVRRTHVNIIDLIEWGRRRGNSIERVQTFRNVADLRAYTKSTKKIFRNTFDGEDGNVVLRHLLRKIFRENF